MSRPKVFPRDRSGFTIAELLVVLGITVVLISIFVPFVRSSREASHREMCAKNLSDIQKAFVGYFQINNFNYPRTRADAQSAKWTAFSGVDAVNAFADDSAVAVNDVSASLFLLVKSQLIQDLSLFICPSSSDIADSVKDLNRRSNFRSPANLSYGYASPFSLADGYRLNDTLPARFAILADKGSRPDSTIAPDAGPFVLRSLNSPNHKGAGQNVLFADGTVRFEITPYCGVTRNDAPGDNIYTALSEQPLTTQVAHDAPGIYSPTAGPSYTYDSLVVPADGFSK